MFDVDGVLTDGSLVYSEFGEELKIFNVKDGVAVQVLKQAGLKVGLLSAKDSPALRQRAVDLDCDFRFFGAHNKLDTVNELVNAEAITHQQIVYVGDDIVDIPVMNAVGLSAAPSDAHFMALKSAKWHLTTQGGRGVAREFADRILAECGVDLEQLYLNMAAGMTNVATPGSVQ